MITTSQIAELVHGHLEGSGTFLVDLQVKPANRIFVYIDGDHGVTIDDCQALTRFLESNLDRDREDFDLTVSSAGADRPLKIPRQYPQHAGRTLEVTLNDGTTITGKLLKALPDSIELEPIPLKKEPKKDNVVLRFDGIKTAKIILSFKK